jgi:predicted nuclease of predicted toxin-antitoxin system
VKFKIDQNLPVEIAGILADFGHDTVTVYDQDMAGAADSGLLSVCQNEGRAMVTFDLDFGDIRTYPPEESSGLIVFRLARQDKPYVLDWVKKVVLMLDLEAVEGRLWIVNEGGIRIRGGDE